MGTDDPSRLCLDPIGVARTPFDGKQRAPRQPVAAADVAGRIELADTAQWRDALCDLATFSHIWVIFWFHHNKDWRPRVSPPRSRERRGVLSTRSPHRPNPIGLSLLQLERIEGTVLHVRGIDLLDGTPVLDIKPYLAYADSAPEANAGWLEQASADPLPGYEVRWSELASEQLRWLKERGVLELQQAAEASLALGPSPHAYRRIRPDGDGFRLALKDFRFRFQVQEPQRRITVEQISSGEKPSRLRDPSATPKGLAGFDVHRDFIARYGD